MNPLVRGVVWPLIGKRGFRMPTQFFDRFCDFGGGVTLHNDVWTSAPAGALEELQRVVVEVLRPPWLRVGECHARVGVSHGECVRVASVARVRVSDFRRTSDDDSVS